jgi:hypothetical protein
MHTSHGAQQSQLTRVYVNTCGAVSAIAWRTGSKSLLLSPDSTHSSLVCMCMRLGAVSAIAWRTGSKSLHLSLRSTHSSLVCMCMHAAQSVIEGVKHIFSRDYWVCSFTVL